ncbi:MAG: leucine-rich repeat protein [Bacteroidales bacterium]|nr:leucine-rich repeat protein [Bacteroidales bacterium]
MKKLLHIIIIAVAFSLFGCQREEIQNPKDYMSYVDAYINGCETRTQMSSLTDGVYRTLWSEGDQIALFSNETYEKSIYTLASGAGTDKGTFVGKKNFSDCYAYYPADKIERINNYAAYVVIPRKQKYVKDTFDPGAYPMFGKYEDGALRFNNILSVLKLNLIGSRQVDSIVVTRKGGTGVLGGSCTINLNDGRITGSYNGDEPIAWSILLDCEDGVQLMSDEEVSFHIVVPPGEYIGLGINIYTPDGVMKKVATSSVNLAPSQIRTVNTLKVQFEGDPDYEEDKIEIEEESTYCYLPSFGGPVNVNISRNVHYEVHLNVDWIKYIPSRVMEQETLNFYVQPNESPERRIAQIFLTYGEKSEMIIFNQDGYEAPAVFLKNRYFQIDEDGETLETTVSGNRTVLEVTSDADWLQTRVIEESVSSNPYRLNKKISMTAGMNDTHAIRSGHIIVATDGMTDTLYISQSPAICGRLEIDVPVAGTLPDIIEGEEIGLYNEVAITGTINKHDISYLSSYDDEILILDLSGVRIEGDILARNTFKNMYQLRELYLPPTLKEIEGDAFENCRSLEYVDWGIDPQLERIGTGHYQETLWYRWILTGPFAGCTSLTEIDIPAKVKEFESGAFMGSGIRKVNFSPDAEIECLKPTALVQSDALGTVAPNMPKRTFGLFMGCEYLEEISIPKSVKEIEASTFINFTSLKRIVIPSTVEYLDGTSLFSGCVNLEYVRVPESITDKIPDGMFSGCTKLKTVIFEGTYREIGANTFYGCTSLTELDLSTVKIIGKYAFQGCTGLKSFDLTTFNTIGTGAFSNTGVESVTIPDDLKELPGKLFAGCASLREVNLNQVVNVSNDFEDCDALYSITIPSTVKTFGTMKDCDNLKKVIMEGGSVEFSYNCFEGCPIEEVFIGNKVISASGSLFDKDYLGDSDVFVFEPFSQMQEFGLCSYMKGVTGIDLPSSVTRIADNGFRECAGLEDISSILTNIKEIGAYAFYNTSIKNLELPEGITVIERNTFSNCKYLQSATLSSTVSMIQEYAFSCCNELRTLVVNAINPPKITSTSFSGCSKLSEIRVPMESVEAYKNASRWKGYADIIEGY